MILPSTIKCVRERVGFEASNEGTVSRGHVHPKNHITPQTMLGESAGRILCTRLTHKHANVTHLYLMFWIN